MAPKYSEDSLHPGHHSIRLHACDYAKPGCYFVTICTYRKQCILSRVAEGRVQLSDFGRIAEGCWRAIPEHFAHAMLREFVIMPNHLHGIVELVGKLGRSSAALLREGDHPRVAKGSLGAIVRSFKAVVTKRARLELPWRGEVWQRNYFERVLRDGKEMADAAAYIIENPKRWDGIGGSSSTRWGSGTMRVEARQT